MALQDLEAAESERKKRAQERLLSRVKRGIEEQNRVLKEVHDTVIRDRLVYPHKMTFFADDEKRIVLEYHRSDDTTERVTIHPHALGQLATTAHPKAFRPYVLETLSLGHKWAWELAAHNLNQHFHQKIFKDRRGQPTMFLHRLVGAELRGFLSRNYNRKLLSEPLLQRFFETASMLRAAPVEATISSVRVTLKCMLPHVFEPVPGEFVSVGVSFSNSDFGAGKLKVSGVLMRISSGTLSTLNDELSRVHLGSIIEESDLELSDETYDKELEAHKSAVNDTVTQFLSRASIERTLQLIEEADAQSIPWNELRKKLDRSKLFSTSDVTDIGKLLQGGDDIIDLPPPKRVGDEKVPTLWWVVNTVGWFANKASDADRKLELQEYAGSLLSR